MKTIQLTIRKKGGQEVNIESDEKTFTNPLEIRLIDPTTSQEVIRFPVYAKDLFLESSNCSLRWKGLELKLEIEDHGYSIQAEEAELAEQPELLEEGLNGFSVDTFKFNGLNHGPKGVYPARRATEEAEAPEGAPLQKVTNSSSPVRKKKKQESFVLEIADEANYGPNPYLNVKQQRFLREQCRIEMEAQQRMIRELVLLEKNRYNSPIIHAAEAIADFAGDADINSKGLNNRYMDCQKRLADAARNYRIPEEEREIYVQALKTLTKSYLIVLLNLPSTEWGYLTRYTIKGARNLFDQVNSLDFYNFFLEWWQSLGLESHLNERFFHAFQEGIGLTGPKAVG